MKIRCKLAMGNNQKAIKETNEHINKLVLEWHSEVKHCKERKINLYYYSKDKSYDNVICDFGEKNGLWQTLQSMRNVERSALLKLLKGVKLKDEKQTTI